MPGNRIDDSPAWTSLSSEQTQTIPPFSNSQTAPSAKSKNKRKQKQKANKEAKAPGIQIPALAADIRPALKPIHAPRNHAEDPSYKRQKDSSSACYISRPPRRCFCLLLVVRCSVAPSSCCFVLFSLLSCILPVALRRLFPCFPISTRSFLLLLRVFRSFPQLTATHSYS